jgi:AcrR family transcriptional regulator
MKGHLSYYFAVKDDLLFAVIDALHERFVAFADSWPSTPELAEVVRGHVLLICAELPAARVSYENFRLLRSDRHDVVSAKRDDYERRLRGLIAARLRASGSAASPTVTTRLVLGLLNWHYTWWQPGGSLTPAALADSVVALVDAALG